MIPRFGLCKSSINMVGLLTAGIDRMFSLFINLFDLVNDICLLIYDKRNGRIPNERSSHEAKSTFVSSFC